MSRTLWLNPVFGVSGDMFLGALVAAGASTDLIRNELEALGIDGWDVGFSTVARRGIEATRAMVAAEDRPHRPWSEIDELLASSGLAEEVGSGARRTFRALATAEAARHGVDVDDVQFHEVGAVDAIVDIVGCWAGLASLDVDEVVSAPIGLGSGSVRAAHGEIPHPAPAVLSLLDGVPVVGVASDSETSTPTGVALLVTSVDHWGPVPAGTLIASGLGAGGRDTESHANVLSAVLLQTEVATSTSAVVLETNLDDVTPETIAHVSERLMAAGADDVWTTPIVMKKGRAGHEVRVLCSPGLARGLTEILGSETGTLGIRARHVDKAVFPRTYGSVVVDGFEIGIKAGPYAAKPEYEDLKHAAAASGRTLAELTDDALTAWRSQFAAP